MTMTQTILEQFKEREKEIKKECERLDREMDGKRKGYEKAQADAQDKLTKKRAAYTQAVSEYHALEDRLMAKARAADVDAVTIGEQVKDGQAGLAEMMAAGEREKSARIETQEKLAGAARIIRSLRAEIIQLEKEEAQARVELRYAMSYPAATQIQKLKSEIETLEHGIGAVYEGYAGADADRERATNDVQLCTGNFIYGMVWENLDAQSLRDVRLDPRLHEKFLPELEKIIAEVQFKDDTRVHLTLASGYQTGQGKYELYYRLELPSGASLTTTSVMTKKGGEGKK